MRQTSLQTDEGCWRSATSDAAKTSSGFSLFFASVLMILLLQGALVNSVFGQGGIAVHTTDIRANFGIDADLYARRLMFPPLYPAASCNGAPTLGSLSNIALLDSATSDDWFNPTPGNPTGGVGILDTNGMAAFRSKLVGCGNDAVCKNAMFFGRMAYPNFTVVPYATGVNVFLDAVGVRDHNAIAAAIDSSAFCATSDKNIHDPRSWCLGVAGTPAKNDIVDVAAHIRQNVVNATSPLDTGLWGYAYATTMTTNGDSHLDFELIRCIDYSGAAIGANEYLSHPAGNINSAVMFCGPDSGHTAGHHSTVTGEAVQPGDVLMTVDYSCGGKKTDIALYVWVDTAHVGPDNTTPFSITQYNQIPGRLFDFTTNSNDPTVDPLGGGADYFINSAGVAPFGYNRIRPKTNDTIFWARVNVYRTSAGSAALDTTLGPPYTSMLSGDIQNNIAQLQEVEIGLNFTKAGLAIPPSQGPCQQIFGNLMVKTRSSTSVTSELKDYVGPVQFGAFTNILLEANGDTLDCDNPSVTLCAHATATQPGGITYCWQGPNSATGPCISGPNDSCITVSVPGTYYISASLDGGCTTTDSVVVVGNVDETPPTITCAGNTTIDCPATPTWPPATASDNVDQSVDITLVGETTTGTCPTVYTRTYRATDDCGNTATCSRSVTVRDITAPSITCPVNTTIDCPAVVLWGNATASDACDQSVDVTIVSTVPSGTCPVVHTRTWRATDDCGNTATCSATITVRDITAPSITCPSNQTIDCPAVVIWGNATASDACDASVDVTIVSTVPSGTCPVVHTRTWRATDDCGNTSTCSATITVRDITAPSITCPVNTTIDCPAVVIWGNATASDACDASVDVTIVSTVPSGTCPVVHTRTWRATDDCGNTSTCSATITVRDITAPSITCPVNTTIDCPAVVIWGNATASDACDASVDVTIVSTVPSGTCPVVHTRTWRATDDCGNTSTCSATITVRDITAPSITCPSNQTIDCPAVVIWGNATASDACDASVDVTIVSTVPSGTCPVVHTRTWRATDDCGNTSTCSATITVRDIVAPSITCPSNQTIDCPAVVIWGNATASDACDASVDVTVVSTVPSGTCPVVHTRTWRATDDCGNTATCSATITVRDITAPSITCPVNTTIDCPAVVIWGNATASDACDASVDVTIVSTVPSGTCPVVHTRTWRATDDCGNTSTCSATITVRDITAPSITCPVNTTIDCPAVVIWGNATASDACDASVDVTIVSTVPSGTCPVVHTRTWRATDDCGNTSTCSATITVRDITAPSITCPVNTTIDCPAVVIWGNATASDACDASVDVTIVSTVPSGTCPVVHTRTWRATDDCGNTSTCSATITVRDITAPSITCPSNQTIDCPAVVIWGNATASDACDASVDVTIVSTVPSGTCPVVHTRTWRATDDCGNTSTCSASITVRDVSAPSITCPSNQTIDCPAVVIWGNATASDGCDQSVAVTIVSTVPSGTCPVVHTRTWRATDDCGNTSTCSATITVRDITAPSITCPVNTTIDCPAVVIWGNATASDACDASVDVTIVSTVPSGTCPVVHTRTWRATDDCGNTSTCSATITVRDITAPSITCPVNTTIDCPAVVIWGNATASDACDASVDVTIVSTVPTGTCPVVHTRTWRATDDCGNTSTCSATITVRDITAPSITCPSNQTIDCPAVVIWGNATASDACDASVDVTIVSTVPSGTCPVVHTRTWRATDDCGNTSTCSATITVRDITAPSITCPSNQTIDCPAVVIWGNATASDACDASVDVTIVSTVPSGTCPVVHTRTWRATDDCGNTSTCSATITVRDITAPSITCPVNTTIDCPAVVIWGNATASDACDASVDVTVVSTTPSGSCPVVHTRIWRATDDCGNTSTCSATITVRDITAPSITCPVNTTIDCPAVVIWGNATASDACDANVDVTIVSTVPTGTCPVVHTRTWRATDDCGNTSTCSATITVRDITAPSITCPSNQTIDCPAVVIWGNATASDACDASVDVTIVSTVPTGTCPVVHRRTWKATDDCGNTSTCSATITVRDITAPTITCPGNATITCPATPTWPTVTASDACDQSVAITFGETTANISCGTYNVTRIYRATDDCGNTSTCSRTVFVQNAAPTCTLAVPTIRPICGTSGNTLCATTTNAVSWQWSIVVGEAPYTGAGWSIDGSTTSNCISYTAGSSDSVRFRLVVTNACGCTSTCEVSFGCRIPYWGCTLGFWKNHTSIWNEPLDPISACIAAGISSQATAFPTFGYAGNGTAGSSFQTTFGLSNAQMAAAGYPTSLTLLQALNLGGGTWGLLARSGVAALLNSCGLSGHFYYNSPVQVINRVHDAVAAGSATGANAAGNDFQKHNETQPDACPPAGRATKTARTTVRTEFGTSVGDEDISISAYPNPFTSSATIQFEMTNTSDVTVEVFDLTGKKVANLYNGKAEAGLSYEVQLNGNDLPAGIYIYRINAGDKMYNDRLILIK